jgi:hypothetical protein
MKSSKLISIEGAAAVALRQINRAPPQTEMSKYLRHQAPSWFVAVSLNRSAACWPVADIRQMMPISAAPDRRAADPDRTEDHSALLTGVLQAQNFPSLPHRQSLGASDLQSCDSQRKDLVQLELPASAYHGHFHSESVSRFRSD